MTLRRKIAKSMSLAFSEDRLWNAFEVEDAVVSFLRGPRMFRVRKKGIEFMDEEIDVWAQTSTAGSRLVNSKLWPLMSRVI